MADSYVRVAPDSTGKYIRNNSLYVPIDLLDGAGPVPTLVQQQVTLQANPFGKILDPDLNPLLSELLAVQLEMRDALALIAGTGIGLGIDNAPEPPYLLGMGGLPVAPVESVAPVRAMADRFGRQSMSQWGPRDLYGVGASGTITTTSITTLIPALPNVFADVVGLWITNTSASTTARADVSDGTNTFPFQSIGGGSPVGFFGGGMILPASNKNTAWTITMSGAVTDIRAIAIFVKNR